MSGVRASVGPSPQSTLMGTWDWVDPGYANLRASEPEGRPELEDDSTRLKEYEKSLMTRRQTKRKPRACILTYTHAPTSYALAEKERRAGQDSIRSKEQTAAYSGTHELGVVWGQARSERSSEMSDSASLRPLVSVEHTTTTDEVPECLVAQLRALVQDPSSLPGGQ
ncbi:hypothetical protein BDP55DRAFT_635363 [Colletotrichum godetiae]|uniref:Uncharacterized protein n=1 Tax=Colletotrichum godetiae TaxID=1209918 RepID=A0AAJ0ADL7_9PEZI|nr:uncharacterized protein BDP55DRAFT_635363 [Colletotrichum godetiae]KAK1671940.1 hypothetical protein BDP55DRAFT_635363 [Colletotrichum godetiae]